MTGKRKRRDLGTLVLYGRRLVREFRATLAALVLVILLGAVLYGITPQSSLGGTRPTALTALYGSWMSLLAQPIYSPPDAWYLELVAGVYPLFGVLLIGEGIVRFALLMVSRRRGEKEWMLVMASTYRDHVVLCGLGHLGYRVLMQLVAQGRDVVAIEKDAGGRFVEAAKATGIAILFFDMKDDQALVQAGVGHARAIIAATDDDMANLEVALDAKRMNPTIRTAVRLYDQAMASKLMDAFQFDFAFSSSALAASTVAAMALECRVISAFSVGSAAHVVAEIAVAGGSAWDGASVGELERQGRLRVIRGPGDATPSAATQLSGGAQLVVHAPVDELTRLLPELTARPRGAPARS
jgi:Trk K+ transport system NAD-binding subunit